MEDGGGEAHRVDPGRRLVGVPLLGQLALGGGGDLGELGEQPVSARDRLQAQGDAAHLPGAGGLLHLVEEPRGVVERQRRPRLEPLLEHGPLQIVAHQHEAPEQELSQGAGATHRGRETGPVQVGQDRARPRVRRHPPDLLTGVLEGEEEGFRHRASRLLQGRQQLHLPLRKGSLGVESGPVTRNRTALIQIGGDEVDHLMQGRGQGHLVGCDGGVAVVGGLEHPRIAHDLGIGGGGVGSEPDLELVVAGETAGEAGDGGRHPLIPGHHRLHGTVLRPQEILEHGLFTGAHQPPIFPHPSNPPRVGRRRRETPADSYNPGDALRHDRPSQRPPRDHRADAILALDRRRMLGRHRDPGRAAR